MVSDWYIGEYLLNQLLDNRRGLSISKDSDNKVFISQTMIHSGGSIFPMNVEYYELSKNEKKNRSSRELTQEEFNNLFSDFKQYKTVK